MQHLRCRAAVMDSVIWNGWSSIRERRGRSAKCDEGRRSSISLFVSATKQKTKLRSDCCSAAPTLSESKLKDRGAQEKK